MPTAMPASTPAAAVDEAASIAAAVEAEMEASFRFFWEQATTDPASPGYGLVRDRYPGAPGIASIASVGFALTALPIGVEKGYISREQGYERAVGALATLLKMERTHGFFYHFVDMQTGRRAWNSEVSTIDTGILLMGVLTAGQYFGQEVQRQAGQLYGDVDWPWFVDEDAGQFYMAYRPESGFEGHWDFYAEQLMLYVLAAGSPAHPLDERLYYGFTRHKGSWGQGKPFIHSWFGSLFTYQYSHAWIDFRGYTDRKGVNWFDNSVTASQAQYDFAVSVQDKYKTLSAKAWGLTACDGPDGYEGRYGAPPSGYDNTMHLVDDTVAPSAALGSIVFLPRQAEQALLYYASLPELQGRYGLQDAFNLSQEWFDSDVIGIDKGVTLLMLANYQNDQVYAITMKIPAFLTGLERLGLAQ